MGPSHTISQNANLTILIMFTVLTGLMQRNDKKFNIQKQSNSAYDSSVIGEFVKGLTGSSD